MQGRGPTHTTWRAFLPNPAQVRLKRYLEMRGADGGPWRMICALPALWVGLIYDDEAQRQVRTLAGERAFRAGGRHVRCWLEGLFAGIRKAACG
jgi:glutamate--cysteine ligase